MAERDWMRMVRDGEGINVEFKRQAPKLERLSKSFSAFSNSSGGYVFFGVEDDGTICGLEHLKGTAEIIEKVAQFCCDPPIEVQTHVWEPIRNNKVLVVHIPEAEDKPVFAVSDTNSRDSWPFFRSDRENLPLDRQSLKTMRRTRSSDVPTEHHEMDRHTLNILGRLSESSRQTLGQLAKSANISSHRAKKILVDLERNGWVHSYFNEKRREFSLAIPWKKK